MIISGSEFNNLYSGQICLKLTNDYECHNGLTFKTGLNIDNNTFNENNQYGIHFCFENDVTKWAMYGKNVMKYYRFVTIPDDARVVVYSNKIKTDKLTLSERFELYDNTEFCNPYLKSIVEHFGWTLYYVKNKTPEICEIAVKTNGIALEYIEPQNQTLEICRLAVIQNGYALKFVLEQYQTPEICDIALRQSQHLSQYIKNKSSI